MKLKQLFHEALCEKYLGQTIKSDLGGYFVVHEIRIETGTFGDPPIEVSFYSKEYVESLKKYRAWCNTVTDDETPTPMEIDQPFREAARCGICYISSLDDDLPEL